MTEMPEPPAGRKEVALWSMVSVLLLVVMCAVYVAHGSPDIGPLANPDSQSAVWYTILLAAPYAFVVVLCLRPNPEFLFGFAWTLARAAIIGILLVTVGGVIGLLFLVMMIPTPLVSIGMFAGEIGGQLQGPGLFALLALFAVQFALKYCARQALGRAPSDDAGSGRAFGYMTLLLPVVIFLHLNAVKAASERRAIEQSKAEITSRAASTTAAVDARSPIALEAARTGLHVCVHTGCVDSLLESLRRQRVAVAYTPSQHGGYFAMIAGAEEGVPKYVTNETGILLRVKDDRSPFGSVSWNTEYKLVDSTYLDLELIRNCIRDEIVSEWDQFPLHLPQDLGCYMHGDTTVVHFRHNANYRVIYASHRKPGVKLMKSFSLSARPIEYGKPYVRSFLMTDDTAYVTTADRAARKSDPGLGGCEVDSYYCGGRH